MAAVTQPVVEFYWRPGCSLCGSLREGLANIPTPPIREVSIWDDPQAAGHVRSVETGNETVPTVFVGRQALGQPDPARGGHRRVRGVPGLGGRGRVRAPASVTLAGLARPALGRR